jgi:ABC-2 type transport system permease protein
MTIPQSLRIIRRILVIDLSTAFMYRAEFLMYMISAILSPAISLLIWRAALASGASLPIDAHYLTTYFVMLGVVSMLTSSWTSGFLAEEIRLGKISKWLIRPGSTHFNGIANNLSEKLIKAVPLAPLIAILWWFFREDVALPAGAARWFLFAVSVISAAVIRYALDVLVASLAFWLDDISGIDYARGVLSMVLRGHLIPLALFPAWSQGFMEVQPFRFTLSFSLELLVEDLSTRDIIFGMTLQLLYPVLAVVAARAVWKRGLRAYSAVGA